MEGIEKFRSLIVPFDWSTIERNNSTDSANELDRVLQQMFIDSFPEKSRTIRNTDAPWLDHKTKKLLCKKRRVYKKEGKSPNYYNIANICEVEVKKGKEKFLGKVIEKKSKVLRNTRLSLIHI